ncbi:MAG TPA: hypothetical protein VGE98_10115 [Thermoanaerobaculia bacterium]
MNSRLHTAGLAATLVAVALAALSCASGTPASKSNPERSTALHPMPAGSLAERIARGLIAASPPADVADAAARDAAAQRLGRLTDLLDAAGDRILWGGYEAEKGYDPAAYRLTAFSPYVWTKLYLSTYMFPGPYQVRTEGRFTVLEIAARFRDGLDPGDYPYPFWHSVQKWQAYVDTTAVVLVFDRGRLLAGYRKAVHDPRQFAVVKVWDGRWHWRNSAGEEEPRAALFSFLLSEGNPHAASLETTYRALETKFRSESCVYCHAPDNKHQADTLLLLDFPNQALAARHSLAAVLRGNKMPPPDPRRNPAGGIHDDAVRKELIQLAEKFESEADAALAYEAGKQSQN